MAGTMGAATAAGAVLALAWRAGDALRPWRETGRAVLGAAGGTTAGLLGIGLHLAVAIGWGLLAAVLAGRSHGSRLAATAAGVALLALVVHSTLLPTFRLGHGVGVFPLGGSPLLFLYALFATGLALGMRLAR